MGVFRSRARADVDKKDVREPRLFAAEDRRSGLSKPGGQDGGKRNGRGSGRGPRRKRSWLARSVYWTLTLGLWGLIAIIGISVYFLLALPNDTLFKIPAREPGMVLLADDGQVLVERGSFTGDDIRLDELPPYVPQAVLAIEDRRFYQHFGIDPIGTFRAVIANMRSGSVVQGGSTLTQQLAKNLFLESDRTLERKIQEAVLALWLEHEFSKEEILQLYLNRVYFGAGAYGIEAAAKRYFHKSARDLNLAEAATLAGLLKAPSNYNPIRNPEAAEERAYAVLNAMVEEHYITREQGQKAIDNPAGVVGPAELPASRYVADWIADMVPNLIGSYTESLIVETTIDSAIQDETEAAVRKHLAGEGAKQNAQQAAVVVMDAAGGIKAMVGGRSYSKSQYNRAVRAKRQPGSAFKPFVYLAAMEHGFSPDSVLVDEPVRFGSWTPENYSRQYFGPVTLRTALARSLNTIAAKLAVQVGPETIIEAAHRVGIQSPLAPNASIGLGTSEVTLLELTSAYAAFANGGYKAIPFVINRIVTKGGKVLYERIPAETGRVLDPVTVGEMNDMMRTAIHDGTAKRAMLEGQDAAGKTGTSQNFRDAWFVGYTAHLVAGVWVGNDDGTPTNKATGSGLPAAIWKDVMADAHRGMPALPLPGVPADEPEIGQAPYVAQRERPSVGNSIVQFFEGLFGTRPASAYPEPHSGAPRSAAPRGAQTAEGWNARAINQRDQRQRHIDLGR
ncbi:transglycosylase domain-containing protein [Rhodoligotrophos defluvii]|uniref:transglycosylase domain-containing protein n=1 Tax=Rhodoligotrophos defluvii TaxID=2561934 RepID=UPI0010C98228|nr:penicillin-binding protein 1A [Rhodoligotrophos defluvii]